MVDDRIRRKALSASTSKSMKGCLARFAGEKLLPRDDDPFTVSALGTSTHAVLEDLYNVTPKKRTKLKFLEIRDKHADEMWSEKARLEAEETPEAWAGKRQFWIDEVSRLGLGEFDITDPTQVTTYKTELPFDGVHIAGVPAMGFIDRVEVVKVADKDEYLVIDLKTGKMKNAFELNKHGDDHGDQIRLYSDAIREVTGKPAAIGRIHYTQFGVARDIPLTDAAMQKTREQFRSAWDTHNKVMETGEFTTEVGPLCGWCPLVNACPAAKAAGKVDLTNTTKVNGRRVVDPTLEATAYPAVQLGIPTIRPDAKKFGSKLPPVAPVVVDVAQKLHQIAASAVSTPTDPYADIPWSDVATAAEPAGSAHAGNDKYPTYAKEDIVTNPAAIFSDGKPWEPTINGTLNGASYAAIAVISLPQMAGELLHEAGRDITGASVDALTDLLAGIIVDVQKPLRGGEFDWAAGINTRIRGALRTTLETLPLPWDATSEDEWKAWRAKATKRTHVFVTKAIRTYNQLDVIPEPSYSALLPVAAPSPATVARKAAA
ncbi:RecB family exonuclease [Leifsonia sp. Leaf264]|uniref:RecB family exonuclease n=1 Tax=Leifsonia sp. Leaf264 TaxID=1736314 RepID=UPI0006F874C9|nr:PD-(D/E)XK nuclease family protein [Leifsonia sp. Leaf264]KQO98657.1 hypothetical protein ASF30_11385 [Leifsonia sp. Leaf264]